MWSDDQMTLFKLFVLLLRFQHDTAEESQTLWRRQYTKTLSWSDVALTMGET